MGVDLFNKESKLSPARSTVLLSFGVCDPSRTLHVKRDKKRKVRPPVIRGPFLSVLICFGQKADTQKT